MKTEVDEKIEANSSDGNSQPNLSAICRLCLAVESGTIDIFDADPKLSIPMRMMACAALEVQASDPLPKKICKDCRVQLERSYYFRKKCQLSDGKLRKHIRLLNAGKKSRVFEPRTDDDEDDDDELIDSLHFLKDFDNEKEEIQRQKMIEMEESILERVRQEEIGRIFEEAKEFFASKLSAKSKKQMTAIAAEASPKKSKASSSATRRSSHAECLETVEEETYYVRVPKEDAPGASNANSSKDYKEADVEEYTLVNIKLGAGDNVELAAIDFRRESDNNAEEDNQDTDEFNDEIESIAPDQSDSSNIQIAYTQEGSENMETDDPEQPEENQVFEVHRLDEEDRLDDDEMENDEQSNKYVVIEFDQKRSEINSSDLIETVVPENGKDWKIFKCLHCPQSFTRVSQLERHATVHERVRGYKCDECEKWFACKSSLDRHSRTHTGEKPFECNICERRFIQKEILKRHLSTHTGERPYTCPHCSKSFIQRQMLNAHINSKHTDNPTIRLHECYLCPKSFCHASGLSRHLLTHSGVSYTCKICGKKFSDKSAVKRHTTTVHP